MLGGHKPCIAAPLRGLGRADRPESFRRAWTLYKKNKIRAVLRDHPMPTPFLCLRLHVQRQLARLATKRDGGALSVAGGTEHPQT